MGDERQDAEDSSRERLASERTHNNNDEDHSSGGDMGLAVNSVSEPDFEALLVAIAEKQDRSAFEELFRSFSGRIYGLGMKMVNNEQLAKDLVQEVMLSVWQQAGSFRRDRGSAKSWMFAMSRNKCIDMLRRLKRHHNTLSADEIWPVEFYDLSIDEEVSNDNHFAGDQIDMQIVTRLSHRLPGPQREAIEMSYLAELSHEEAAQRLNIPLGTFKSRLRLGLIKLREMVEQKHA
jgi:RNA polymerase sigma-70 factor (ECF subfamily)